MGALSCVLSGPAECRIGTGVRREFTDVPAAVRALRQEGVEIVMGAVPFEPNAPTALLEPVEFELRTGPWRGESHSAGPIPEVESIESSPTSREHARHVATAVQLIRAGALEKVVLARRMRLKTASVIDGPAVLRRLIDRDPASTGYYVDLSGVRGPGAALVGSSPELLVRRTGNRVECRPLAGSARRTAAAPDGHRALSASAKDRREHRFVIDFIDSVLRPLCTELHFSPEPEIFETPDMWHLGTPMHGTLADPALTALDLVSLLQPTPALGGSPRGPALDLIAKLEGERGFYGGAVGWCDAAGDGAWAVGIRCAEIAAGGYGAVAFAGGGIVAESSPAAEVDETTAKFRTVLSVFDVEPVA